MAATGSTGGRRQWYRNSLLIGILGSLVAGLILQPLIVALGSWVFSHTNPTIQFFRDRAFYAASQNVAAIDIQVLKTTVTILPIYALTISYFILIGRLKKIKSLRDKILYPPQHSRSAATDEAGVFVKEARNIETLGNVFLYALPILVGVFASVWFIDFSMDAISIKARNSFETNLAIASPSMTPQAERDLKSQFFAVSSEADYNEIKTIIIKGAKTGNRKLKSWP